jgi:hypothetical protein
MRMSFRCSSLSCMFALTTHDEFYVSIGASFMRVPQSIAVFLSILTRPTHTPPHPTLTHTLPPPPTHTLYVELKRLRLEDRHSSKSSEPMSYSQTVMNEKQSKIHSSHSGGDGEAGHSSAPQEREREKPHNNHNK